MRLPTRWGKIVAVVAALAVLAGAGLFIVRHVGTRTVPITMMFTDASPLIPGNVVRIDGIQVGLISSVELRNGQAAVTADLDPSALPLHVDASATIRPVTLLGERFIELDRGSVDKPAMVQPLTITAKHTSASVDLDQVVNSLNDPTSAALAALVTTLGDGTLGQGTNIDDVIKALAPVLDNTNQLGQILDSQNSVLTQLVDQATPVAKALAGGNGNDLDQAVQYAEQLLSSVSAQRDALTASIQELPATLASAQRTLSQLAGVADNAVPVLQSVRPVTDNLSQITSELDAFADSANPALDSLPKVLDEAKALLDQAQPVVRDLEPGTAALPTVGSSANRLVGALTPKLTTVLDFMRDWALSTNGRDGLSNYFRAFLVTTPQSLLQFPGVGLGGTAPTTTTSQPAGQPAQPGAQPTSPAPSGSSTVAPPPLLSGLLPSGGGATGLDPTQENSLLGELLGGL